MQKHEGLSVDQMKSVVQRLTLTWPTDDWVDSVILVAVSGGPDSVALLRLLHVLKQERQQNLADLHVVHVNHRIRKNSDQDAQFVIDLARQLGIKSHLICREHDGPESGWQSEQALRQFRYRAILETAHRLSSRLVVTAHTADDQMETLLFRLARGTGLYGLTGIPVVRVKDGVSIVRPLLKIRKTELLGLLKQLDQPFCIDETNDSSGYARNFIRNEIIPALSQKFGGQFSQSLERIAFQAAEQIQLLDELAEPLIVRHFDGFGVADLAQAHPVVVRHALRTIWKQAGYDEGAMTAEKWKLLQQFVVSGNDGHLQLPGAVTARLLNGKLTFERTTTNR